ALGWWAGRSGDRALPWAARSGDRAWVVGGALRRPRSAGPSATAPPAAAATALLARDRPPRRGRYRPLSPRAQPRPGVPTPAEPAARARPRGSCCAPAALPQRARTPAHMLRPRAT